MDPALVALPIAGLAIGLLVTLLGGGGGVFYLPVLVAVFGVPYKVAVPTSIATIIPTTLFGSVSHYRDGNVAWRTGTVVIVGTVLGTLIGTQLAGQFTNETLERAFGLFLLTIAALSALRSEDSLDTESLHAWSRGTLGISIGAVAGVATALFGISGTPILLPGLYLLGLSARVVIGTSVFVILGNAVGGVFWYSQLQGVDWRLVALFGSGTAVGALITPYFYRYLPGDTLENWYERLFDVVLLGTGAAFLFGLV